MSPYTKPTPRRPNRLRRLQPLLIKIALQPRFDNIQRRSQYRPRHPANGPSDKGDPCLRRENDAPDGTQVRGGLSDGVLREGVKG